MNANVNELESVYSIEAENLPWTDGEKNDAKKILQELDDSEDFDLSPFYVKDNEIE